MKLKFWKKDELPEEKPVGRMVSWNEWHDSKLLPAVKSYLVSVYTDKKELRNFVCPNLVDIDIVVKGDVVHFIVKDDVLKPHIDSKCTSHKTFMFCMSDDPSMDYAGDWTQMGCMRIFFVAYNPTYKWSKGNLIVTAARKDFIVMDDYNEVSVDKVTR